MRHFAIPAARAARFLPNPLAVAMSLALAGGAIALAEIGNSQLDRLGWNTGHRESAEIP